MTDQAYSRADVLDLLERFMAHLVAVEGMTFASERTGPEPGEYGLSADEVALLREASARRGYVRL